MIFSQEPDAFDYSSALDSFDKNLVHNITPIRDMDYFREEWKNSKLYQSVINRYLVTQYFHYIPIRGDGNCAYRAAFVRYMQIVICENKPHLLTNLQENIERDEGIYQSSWCYDFIDKYKPILEKYIKQIEEELAQSGLKNALILFHKMVLLSSEFDKGLVMLLRIMVANFIKTHTEDSFNGLPIEFIFNQKHSSLKEYIDKEVMQLGEEAQDLAIMLIPVVLRIGVRNVMISNEANDGIKIEEYPCKTDQTKLTLQDGLNFHNVEHNSDAHCITLFFRPGHYEILLQNEFIKHFPQFLKSFEFMKQFGYNERGALIKHMSFVERMSEDSKVLEQEKKKAQVRKIKFHCSHEFERNEIIQNLKKYFEFDDNKPEIQDFFEKSNQQLGVPQCFQCKENFSFNDYQQIWPESKFTRRSYVNAKTNYEHRLEQKSQKIKDEQVKIMKESSWVEVKLPDQFQARKKVEEIGISINEQSEKEEDKKEEQENQNEEIKEENQILPSHEENQRKEVQEEKEEEKKQVQNDDNQISSSNESRKLENQKSAEQEKADHRGQEQNPIRVEEKKKANQQPKGGKVKQLFIIFMSFGLGITGLLLVGTFIFGRRQIGKFFQKFQFLGNWI